MMQYFLEGRYKTLDLHHVRMAFSEDITEVGKAGPGKVGHLIALIVRIIKARFRTGARILYYPPASPNLAPFLRDCAVLICTRWLFQKTVFHFHANGISEFRRSLPGILQWLYRRAYGRPELSICLSKLAVEDAKDFNSLRTAIVPNGIPDHPDAGFSKHMDVSCPVILYLGTVSEEKGVGVLLDALGVLAKKKQPFRCIIAGPFASASEETVLRQRCAALELDTSISWRGAVSGNAKWACYLEADVFCFPSYYKTEGLPIVLIEAMMFSLPIVATSWRAIPEIVLQDKNGFLTPTHDPQAVATQLLKLLRNSILVQDMGNSARNRFATLFTVEEFRCGMEEALSGLEENPVQS